MDITSILEVACCSQVTRHTLPSLRFLGDLGRRKEGKIWYVVELKQIVNRCHPYIIVYECPVIEIVVERLKFSWKEIVGRLVEGSNILAGIRAYVLLLPTSARNRKLSYNLSSLFFRTFSFHW